MLATGGAPGIGRGDSSTASPTLSFAGSNADVAILSPSQRLQHGYVAAVSAIADTGTMPIIGIDCVSPMGMPKVQDDNASAGETASMSAKTADAVLESERILLDDLTAGSRIRCDGGHKRTYLAAQAEITVAPD